MASMIQQSPPEILSAICEIIADDDERNTRTTHETKFKTLKTLSQACRAFLPHCRGHIFHSINIHDSYNPKDRTAESFTRLVERTPEIAEFVRTLKYGMRLHDDLHFLGVATALDKLTNVKSLALNTQGYAQNWNNIPASTECSLLKLIRSPSLVALELRYIGNLDLSLFLPCPNLQSLSLHAITFYDEANAKKAESVDIKPLSVGPVNRIRLQKLQVENIPEYEEKESSVSMLFGDGQSVLDLSGLKSVAIWISKEHQVELAKSILSKAPQVESIEMAGEDHELMDFGAAAIVESGSALSALRSLTFKVYPVDSEGYTPLHPFPGICKSLSSIAPKAHCLEVINIHVFLFNKTFTEDSEVNTWRDLERTLLGSEWPSLRHVQLDITSYVIGGKKAIEELKNLRDTQFPLLSQDQHKFTFGFSVSGP